MIIYLASYTFLSLKFFLMEQSEKSPKDNFKNALCYIPLVAVLLFFIEENKTTECIFLDYMLLFQHWWCLL